MHLTHHTTTGKRKGKFKYSSAEHKRQAQELEREWNELKNRHESKSIPVKIKTSTMKRYRLEIPEGRGTGHIPSRKSDDGVAFKKDAPQYTGNSVVGITIMHKSCLQPVFSQQEAIDAANMRRG
jgi:hypothetical protein